MKQHMQIAISVSVVGLLYLVYTKYIEFVNRQERLELNLRNVIDAVNNHYLSQLNDEDTENNHENGHNDESDDDSDDDNVDKRVVFDCDEDGDDEIMASCALEDHEENYNGSNSSSEDESPIIITKSSHCLFNLTMGKNKGRRCGKNTVQDGYCKLHLKHIPVPM